MGALVKVQALSARLCYLLHNLVAVFYTNIVLEQPEYRVLFLLTLCIIIEAGFTVFRRGGVESKWFSSSTLVFLTSTVPCIWLLEIDRLETFTQQQNAANITEIDSNISVVNTWAEAEAIQLPGVDITVTLPRETWLEVIKQSFLGIVIFGRWLLPLGTINRNQLSLLLFVYFAMASDIMELFQLFEDPRVTRSPLIPYFILGAWSLSLVQFVIVLTMTRNFRHRSRPVEWRQSFSFRRSRSSSNRSRKSRFARDRRSRVSEGDDSRPNCFKLGCLSSDVWSIMVTLTLMDGTFLAVRMYVVIGLQVIGYNVIFFLIKNFFIVLLSLYRLSIIFASAYEHTRVKGKKSRQQGKMNSSKTSSHPV